MPVAKPKAALTSFTFRYGDDGEHGQQWGNPGPIAKTMTIHVTPVNDPPALTSVNTLTGAVEDTLFTLTCAALGGAANEAGVDEDRSGSKR